MLTGQSIHRRQGEEEKRKEEASEKEKGADKGDGSVPILFCGARPIDPEIAADLGRCSCQIV